MKKQELSINKTGRRQYDSEFKASALRMIAQGRSVADVSRALGVHQSILHKWKSAAQGQELKTEETSVDELMCYIRQLETEREILKKALSIFSRTM